MQMALNLNRIITNKRVIGLIYHITYLYCRTFRIEVVNDAAFAHALSTGGRVLLCGWHQYILATLSYFPRFSNHSPMMMISRSRDGDFAAGIAERFGWTPIRGSSSKGGAAGLFSIIKKLRKGQLGGHVVDGPRGPAGRVKSGTIQLATAADAIIIPVFISADRFWHLNSWDRFIVPKPFARLTIRFGEIFEVGRLRKSSAVEEKRRSLEEIMRPGLAGF